MCRGGRIGQRGSFLQGSSKGDEFGQGSRDAAPDRVGQGGHQLFALSSVGLAVGRDHPLVDLPGRLDLHVLVDGEQRLEAGGLLVGEEVGAAPTPLVGFGDPARQDCTIRLEVPPGDDAPELVEAAESRQIGAGERARAVTDGHVRHVEVFQMASMKTPILGRPRPLSRDRHARFRYSLNCEEPSWLRISYFLFRDLLTRAMVTRDAIPTRIRPYPIRRIRPPPISASSPIPPTPVSDSAQ